MTFFAPLAVVTLVTALAGCATPTQPSLLDRAEGLVLLSAPSLRVGINPGTASVPPPLVPTVDVVASRPGHLYLFALDARADSGRLLYPDAAGGTDAESISLRIRRPAADSATHVLAVLAAEPQDTVRLAADVAGGCRCFVVRGDHAASLVALPGAAR